MGIYFGNDIDVAIVDFQNETDVKLKNVIFHDRIKAAMEKLIQSQLYLYGFYKMDNPDVLKAEALSHLYEIIPKFDATKGKKAFSYFNVVLKNWFVGRLRQISKRRRQEEFDKDILEKESFVIGSYESSLIEREYMVCLINEIERWRHLLVNKHDIQVLDALSFMLRNPDSIDIYNKKAILFYLREITKLSTKKISHSLNQFREMYSKFRKKYEDGEEE